MVMVFTKVVRVAIAMTVIVAIASTQNPCTCDVHGKPEASNWDGLGKMDWHWRKKTTHGLVANEDGDGRQNDRA